MGRRPRFDRHDLVVAGLGVTRRHGWSAVSGQSVAAALQVTPMALYRLVPDADALRRAIADFAGRDLVPEVADGPLLDVLAAWADRAHAALIELPGLASYLVHEWTELPTWLGIVEELLAAAERDGVVGADAVHTVNAVFSFVLARAQLREAVAMERGLRPLRDHPERYPHIGAQVAQFRTAQTDTAFRFGLRALLLGLREANARQVTDHGAHAETG